MQLAPLCDLVSTLSHPELELEPSTYIDGIRPITRVSRD